jgi:hypothetical protein
MCVKEFFTALKHKHEDTVVQERGWKYVATLASGKELPHGETPDGGRSE